ncbi:nicotinamide riboside transporter PnuC [Polluticaenibacter yanchengensis]|uniref:Nicotinamide riboside transporter PnuC n=1 Tax=Polluticaenibacter yanchengensis TaxID=3014562 RepID=A0ABT4UN39_9BACT|nr:nicotinamide riboside transporter PnuC [Chitinophagaceae bacterium LY-5]
MNILGDIIKSTSWLEWFGVGFSVTQVLLSRANNPKNYFFGIAGILLTIFVMYQSKLYAEMLLNVYYLVMSIYGVWFWMLKKNEVYTPITFSTKKDLAVTLGIVGVAFLLLFSVLKNFTSSDVPVWDAWVSATAWAGMWLMAKRKVENWILLNISNIFAIPLLWHKELYLYSLLTAFLFIVAVFGYFNWRRIIKEEQEKKLYVAK